MLINTDKYACSLKKLWSDVFGDSEEYISLIFDNGYTPTEVFGEISDGEVVSALYLLKCKITAEGKTFEGRYLYAAATLDSYRKQGIMGKLINEAQKYSVRERIDFIALVPASEKLYGYYSRYGFVPLMNKYVSVVSNGAEGTVGGKKIEDAECLTNMRNYYKGNKFMFDIPEMKYALSCLDFAGYHVYKNSEDSYYISDKTQTEIIEYISSEENFTDNTKNLLSKLNNGTEISSPYNLSEFCESKKQTFGMVYTENDIFKRCAEKGIYMNIALD